MSQVLSGAGPVPRPPSGQPGTAATSGDHIPRLITEWSLPQQTFSPCCCFTISTAFIELSVISATTFNIWKGRTEGGREAGGHVGVTCWWSGLQKASPASHPGSH